MELFLNTGEQNMNIYNIDFKEPNDLDCSSYLQINDCGMIAFRNKTAGILRSKGRSDYQLIYVESGQFEVEYNGVNHHLKQGFVLYPPNIPQKYIDYIDTKRIWVHFTGYNIEEIMKDAHLDFGIYSVSHSPIIQNLLLQLIAEYNQTKAVSSANGLLLYILYMLGKQINNSNTSNDYLQNAITYITANYTKELHIKELANVCNLSQSHFMYLFKEEIGMTPLAYQQTLRIKDTMSALISTEQSINEIATQVGYQDPLYFSRVFKKLVGVSPREYRRQNTNEQTSGDIL